jgi:hypothetical protein
MPKIEIWLGVNPTSAKSLAMSAANRRRRAGIGRRFEESEACFMSLPAHSDTSRRSKDTIPNKFNKLIDVQ